MLPLGDNKPTRRIAFVNLALIAANLGVFVHQIFYAHQGAAAFIHRFGFIPRMLSKVDHLPLDQAGWVPITLVTSLFLHGGWFHLGSNMLFLWIFGDNVEDRLGRGRYLLFYLLCGLLASLTHFCVHPDSGLPTIGASGAVAGVMGAYLILFPRARIRTLVVIIIFIQIFYLPAWFLISLWIITQILSAYTELEWE